MDKKLKKTNMEYLQILHILWQLADYYSKLLQIIAGNNPAKISDKLYETNGITHICVNFPKVQNVERNYSVLEMKEIFNEYMRYVLLPNQQTLRPYYNSQNQYDYLEPLYIDLVYEDSGYINIDVVYIDNSLAYEYVREQEEKLWI